MKTSVAARAFLLLVLIAGPGLVPLPAAGAADEAADVVKRNVAAAGGEARLAAVQSLSFTAGLNAFTATPSGRMKVVVRGLPPAVLEVTLVEPGRVVRNGLGGPAEVGDVERARLTFYARLFGGCFTLRNFAAGLRSEGPRRFGPQTFHRLRAEIPPMTAEFDVDTAEGLLRQVALRGTNPDGSRYEEFFDMGPYAEVAGVKMPSSWFRSTVGGRGSLSEFAGLAFDLPLEPDFFTKADINAGEVKVGPGSLEGAVLSLLDQGGSFVLLTNWTPEHAAGAGLASGAALRLRVEDLESDAVYFARANEIESANAYQPGARLLTFDPQRGGTLWILYFTPPQEEAAAVKARVKGLSPVAVRLRER
jgi:hypothetical protein